MVDRDQTGIIGQGLGVTDVCQDMQECTSVAIAVQRIAQVSWCVDARAILVIKVNKVSSESISCRIRILLTVI